MTIRKPFLAVLTLGFLAPFSPPAEADDAAYKISLINGVVLTSGSAPVPSGSMLLVKNLSNGSLTAVPAELVANVSKSRTADTALGPRPVKMIVPAARLVTQTDSGRGVKGVILLPDGRKVSNALSGTKMAGTVTSANIRETLAAGKLKELSSSVSTARTEGALTPSLNGSKPTEKAATRLTTSLDPGQKVFLGPTGGTPSAASRDTTVVSARGPAAMGLGPLAASVQDQIFVGDLPRLTPRSGLTAGTFAPTTGEVVIGPNGFPIPVTAATAASSFAIGPNGFPDFAAAARGPVPAVSPNGFPATAATVSPTGLTRSGGAIPTALPVTVSAATAATAAGLAAAPATSIGTAGSAAPAAASPR